MFIIIVNILIYYSDFEHLDKLSCNLTLILNKLVIKADKSTKNLNVYY